MGTGPGARAHRARTLAAGPIAARQRTGLNLVSVPYATHAHLLAAVQTGLLLADEPTDALDSVNAEAVMRLMLAICRRGTGSRSAS